MGVGIGEHDLVIIGGGVAGYVAAIKAGQEGLKVRSNSRWTSIGDFLLTTELADRLSVSRSVVVLEAPA